MNSLQTTAASNRPATRWRWRDRRGERHDPASMATTHVFHAVRAIWNAAMPAAARIPGCRVYTFDASTYPITYLLDAVHELIAELGRRELSVLDGLQRDHLNHMIDWLKSYQVGHDAALALPASPEPQR